MHTPKARSQCHYLTWEGNTPHQHSTPHSRDEAETALRALAGFTCSQCSKPLTEKQAYICCNVAHCPLCNASLRYRWSYLDSHCKHLAMWRNDLGLKLELMYADDADDADVRLRQEMAARLNLALPAGTRGAARRKYPVWAAQQVVEAYGLTLTPIVERVFGKDLRARDDEKLNRTLLETCLHPDRHILHQEAQRSTEYWFCSDPHAAVLRAIRWSEAITEGTKRLQTLTPKQWVFLEDWE